MNKNFKKIYHQAIGALSVIVVIFLCIYIYRHHDLLIRLKQVDVKIIIYFTIAHFFNYLFLGLSHKFPLKKIGVRLSFKEWFGLATSTELFNILLPAKGGTALRLMYLNEKKHVEFKDLILISLFTVLLGMLILSIIGILYHGIFLTSNAVIFKYLLWYFYGCLLVVVFVYTFFDSIITKFKKIKLNYHLFHFLKDKKLLLQMGSVYLGIFLLYPLKVKLSFSALGVAIGYKDTIELSFTLLITSFYQLLPGNLGFKEVVTGYMATQYGIPFEMAVLVSLMDRAILLIFLFPVGYSYYLNLYLDFKRSKIK
jgi:uncharacterized membrane protein YbhN (UPF0104 family)